MTATSGKRTVVAIAWAATGMIVLAGCGAGQEAATSEQRSSSPGTPGEIGSIQIRDVQFPWSDPVAGDTVYPSGADAPLQATIVNGEVGVAATDRLVAVSSPIATSARIVGDAAIPDGQVLVAGYDGPVSSITLDGAREVAIALEDLTAPIRAGLTYPVVFTFADAGELQLQVGVENPAVLPPRARNAEQDPAVIGTGPEPVVVPSER